MIKSFYKFIVNNFTINVFVSVIVFKIFVSVLDDIIAPVMLTVIDPNQKISACRFKSGNYSVEYGRTLRNLFVSFITLFIVYIIF